MDYAPEDENESHVLNAEQVTVKQEVLDEGYSVAVENVEEESNDETFNDIPDTDDKKLDAHWCGDVLITKSDIPLENVKTEKESYENLEKETVIGKERVFEVKKENVYVEEQNKTYTQVSKKIRVKEEPEEHAVVDIKIPDTQSKAEKSDDKDDEEMFDDSVTEREFDKESVDKDDQLMLEKKGYTCEICKKKFIKKSSLSGHEITHTGETPFKCQFCNKGFNVRSNLNVHLRIHTGQRPHMCDICQKTFRQAGQLQTHERIHKGEKPYTCSLCTGSFRSSSSLITHQRTHTGERPFPCDICSRSFSTSTSLKTHRITHYGTMLYDCPVCGRQFNRKNNLNVHIKRHNKNRKFSCPLCSNGFVMRAHLLGHLKRAHKNNTSADQFEVLDNVKGAGEEVDIRNKHEEEIKIERMHEDTIEFVDSVETYNDGIELKNELDLERKSEAICDIEMCDNLNDESWGNKSLDVKNEGNG